MGRVDGVGKRGPGNCRRVATGVDPRREKQPDRGDVLSEGGQARTVSTVDVEAGVGAEVPHLPGA